MIKRLCVAILLFLFCFSQSLSAALTVDISGVPEDLQQALRDNLSILKYQTYALQSDTRMYLLYNQGKSEITAALQPYGYYRATVTARLKASDHQDWQVEYQVDPGAQLTIGQLKIQIEGPGQDDPNLINTLKHLPLKPGAPLLHENYESAKDQLLSTAVTDGYFEAKLSQHQIDLDLNQYTSKIVLTLVTGPRYQVGKITFQQHALPYQESFLQRFLNIKTGQPYQAGLVSQLQANLSSSQYFSQVFVAAKPDENSKTVAINIQLTSKKAQQYTVGAGYGTDTKLRGLLGWNLSHITDTGQHFSAQISASALYSQFTANYIIPGKNPLTDSTSLNASQSYITVVPYNATLTGFGADYIQQLGKWQRDIGIHQYFVDYSTPSVPSANAHYLLPSIQGLYDGTYAAGYWAQGYTLTLNAQTAVAGAFSNFNFLQGTANYNYSLPFTASDRFFVQVNAGATAVNSVNDLPPTLRFYAGGVDSVRGYSYDSLGPTDSNGNLLGGIYLLTTNFNYEHHLFGNWSGIVFYDTGNAFNTFNDIDPQSGAGVGISWRSPVGPFRLYISQALDTPGRPWRIDFSIGARL